MTILVTGATGAVGARVLAHLAEDKVETRALTRSPERADLPEGVSPVAGDLGDVESARAAMSGVSTLFLLVPNIADELTQAMLALEVARESGVRNLVYLSVFKAESYVDTPHFAGKAAVERLIHDSAFAATVLRPCYFMQNDLRMQEALLRDGVYRAPVGRRGVSMIDLRDIGRAAARALARRERGAEAAPAATYPLVGPDALCGEDLARIWSTALGREVRYGGDDLEALEKGLAAGGPAWLALDMKLMMRRYQTDGAAATPEEIAETAAALGRAPRAYRDFAAEAAESWAREGRGA